MTYDNGRISTVPSFHSEDVPQADILEDVVATARAVAGGARSDQDIARAIRKDPRQGRYYRRAAEIVGLTLRRHPNLSELSELGQAVVSETDAQHRRVLLSEAVMRADVFRDTFEYIRATQGVTVRDVRRYLLDRGLGRSVAYRRAHTILSWLRELDLIALSDDTYRAIWRPAYGGRAVEIVGPDIEMEPAPPPIRDLGEMPDIRWVHRPKHEDAQETAEEKQEQAATSHRRLIERMATVITVRGSTPLCSGLMDLLAEFPDTRYLFEMKSCTLRNMRSQVRRGVGQLIEYRYLYRLENPLLCLVLEREPSGRLRWLIDFLWSVGVHVCWPAGAEGFTCSAQSREALRHIVDT